MVVHMSKLNIAAAKRHPNQTRPTPPKPNTFTSPLPAAPPSPELVLIHGLPDSGKTTIARELASNGFEHFEADMFFTIDGVYRYDASCVREAHAWCQKMTRQALSQGKRFRR